MAYVKIPRSLFDSVLELLRGVQCGVKATPSSPEAYSIMAELMKCEEVES